MYFLILLVGNFWGHEDLCTILQQNPQLHYTVLHSDLLSHGTLKIISLHNRYYKTTLGKVLRFVGFGGPAIIVLYRSESPVAALY